MGNCDCKNKCQERCQADDDPFVWRHDLEATGRNETVGKKIRESEIKKIPFMIVVGENEVKNNTISIRRHHGEDLGEMKIEKFVDIIKKEISDCIPKFNIN
jgi:threonyl-tRNA synthetase